MKKLFHKFVKDKDDNVVIFQSPNLPILGWFVSVIIALIVPAGFLKTGFMNLSAAFLFLWAYLEITQGASYLRRLAGLIVLFFVAIMYFV